jgi:steroid delta-isomerase
LSADAPKPSAVDPADSAVDIAAAAGALVAALHAGDPGAVGRALSSDARWTRPVAHVSEGADVVQGRDAIVRAVEHDAAVVSQDGPLRVTRGTEVAWPSRERRAGAGDAPETPRIDIVDVDASGLIVNWTTLRGAANASTAEASARTGDNARRAALEQYVTRVGRADSEAVLTLFAPECDVEDPVGTPMHRGRAAVEAFYRTGLASITATTPLGPAVVSGNVGAIPFRVDLQVGDRALSLEVVDVMTFDAEHRFTSMRAFWGRTNRATR